jgi:hypothetical protein
VSMLVLSIARPPTPQQHRPLHHTSTSPPSAAAPNCVVRPSAAHLPKALGREHVVGADASAAWPSCLPQARLHHNVMKMPQGVVFLVTQGIFFFLMKEKEFI